MMSLPGRWTEDPWVAQALFAATFVIGVAGVLVLKAMDTPQAFVTSWPIVWMTLYASLVFIPPFRLRADAAADNVYYLGFLFTLVSLGYSLYRFNLESGLDEVVRNFGIAIASTIAGVFYRVVLSQMRVDPYETERAVRLALSDSARALRGELDNAIVDFASFRRQMQQTTADGMRELGDLAASEITTAADRFGKTVETATGRITSVVEGWTEGSNRYFQESGRLVDAMAGLSNNLVAVRAPADILEEKLGPAAASIDRIFKASDVMLKGLEGSSRELQAGSEHLSGITREAGALLESARRSGEAAERLPAIVETVGGAAQRIGSSVDASAAALTAAAERVTAALGAVLDRVDGRLRELEERADVSEAAAEAAHLRRMDQARHAFAAPPVDAHVAR